MSEPFNDLGSTGGLRRGFTSGSTVQAAAKAAAIMAITGEKLENISFELANGMELTLPIAEIDTGDNWASCCVIKQSGDDPDVTDGHPFCCRVDVKDSPGITVTGGYGVGWVTKAGLPVEPGNPAINPTPMKMIKKELKALLPEGKGLHATVTIPDGPELAKKTWNPRLGIEGGISVIGTTGIVEPKSTAAWEASIDLYIKVAAKASHNGLLYLPLGYIGEKLLVEKHGISSDLIMKTGDKVGYSLKGCREEGISRVLLIGHIGKLAKIAAGIFDTNYRSGDARLETVAAWAAASGATTETVVKILNLKLAEASVEIITAKHLERTFYHMVRRASERCEQFMDGEMTVAVAMTDLKGNLLASSPEGLFEEGKWLEFIS